MILRIEIDGTIHNLDVGDVSDMTPDERSQSLDVAMAQAGLDINSPYVILGEA